MPHLGALAILLAGHEHAQDHPGHSSGVARICELAVRGDQGPVLAAAGFSAHRPGNVCITAHCCYSALCDLDRGRGAGGAVLSRAG